MVTLTELLYKNSHDTEEGVLFDWDHWEKFKEGLRTLIEDTWDKAIETRSEYETWGTVDWDSIHKVKQEYINTTGV